MTPPTTPDVPEDDLPLAGVRVIDLTTVIFGPYCTQILGDWGADVIKVEAPGGDTMRQLGPSRSPGMAAVFMGANRNKRSLELDLKRPEARAALMRLIEGADLFVHNIRPQKIEGLGLGPEAVLTANPRIVYGAMLGFGEDGPYGGRPAYDDVIQAMAGIAGAFLARDGEPQLMPQIVADKTAALTAASALLAAYVRTLRTGKGARVDCPMFESLAAWTLVEHQYGAVFEPPETPAGYPRVLSAHRRPHATADGFVVILPYTDAQWARFWEILGRPDLAGDPRFAGMRARGANIDALYGLVSPLMAARTTAEWLDAFGRAEIPCGPILPLDRLAEDPHLAAVGAVKRMEHPTEGPLNVPQPPGRLDRAALPVRRLPPRLNEHGRDILAEAGLSPEEIETALGTAPA
ncbi:MAG TPA: CoA transferase [Paracoccaceae bacterium]|nr:CoA transferase [Paracoccaceae bacterium]